VIAVRATPPRLLAGEAAIIDLLVTSEAAGPDEVAPAMLTVAPDTIAALAGVVHGDQVIAPDDETLDQARVALGLRAGEPVPVSLIASLELDDHLLVATKTVWLGDHGDNPAIDEIRIAGTPADAGAVVAPGMLELAIDAAADDRVDWLTSVGELSDFDDPVAHLDVTEAGDATLVVVRRDDRGGVAWRSVTVEIR
jgi:hypothetical protein